MALVWGVDGSIGATRPWAPEPLDLDELVHRPAFHADAACKESSANFFPRVGEDSRPAKAVCHTCLVQDECRAWALAQGTTLSGIWGGTTGLERRMMRRGS